MFDRGGAEGPESSAAGTEHAQSVSAAGGAWSLHHDAHREPECDWLHVRSFCK